MTWWTAEMTSSTGCGWEIEEADEEATAAPVPAAV
jgi:hypothetical protein